MRKLSSLSMRLWGLYDRRGLLFIRDEGDEPSAPYQPAVFTTRREARATLHNLSGDGLGRARVEKLTVSLGWEPLAVAAPALKRHGDRR